MINADFPAQISNQVPDSWLDSGTVPTGDLRFIVDADGNTYFDCTRINDGVGGVLRMRPRGTKITSVTGQQDYGLIRGCLWDENERFIKNHPFNVAAMDPTAMRRVYRGAGTTARGIIIYG